MIVTVGPHGRFRRIELSPRVHHSHSASELADAAMALAERATAGVTEQGEQPMTPHKPDGALPDDAGEHADPPLSQLPKPDP
ncbi:hypothetical protein ABGB18_45380 [Nonomuraea sp. B12E4]|uniref:hypothetical protein n=1 Tax=Nonomuraea sp. B12E4 TaxID=3153564 RepID=UPI00325C435E